MRTKIGRSGNSIDSKRYWRHRLNMEELPHLHLLKQLRHWNQASPTLRHWHLLTKKADLQSMSKSWTRSALNGQSRLQSMSKSWTRSQHTTQWPKSTAVQRQLHHVPGLRRRLRSRKGSGSKSSRMPIEKLLLERLRQQRLGVFMPIEKLLPFRMKNA